VIIIIERDKTEGLEDAPLALSHRVQHLGHTLHLAGVRLERDFHEITLRQSSRQLKQASGDGNHLNVAFGLLAVAELDYCRGGCEFNSSSTMSRVALGIVCHAGTYYPTDERRARDYRSAVSGFVGLACP
jgi:hypothetical protein